MLVLALLAPAVAGCVSPPAARYVYQDGQFGVVGIPRNSPLGKTDYRAQAHDLMIRHFPEGYEIVRAEEVVSGERTLDTAIKKELETEPGFLALNQMLKLGKIAKSSAIDQKDITHITESRIIYRRKPDNHLVGPDGFAAVASVAPEFYIDPNDSVRKGLKEATFLARKDDKEKDKDKEKQVADAKPVDKDKHLAEARTKDDSIRQAGGHPPE